MSQYCENFKAILVATNESGDTLVARTRCKQWTCSYCANVNKMQWQKRLIDHINKKGGKWSWWTLTAHSGARGAELSIKNLRSAHDKIMKRMKRKYGKFDYCRVYEPHKDSSFHLHAIGSFHFGDTKTRKSKDGTETKYSQWLASIAKKFGLGWYTHADDLHEDEHGGYIASYIAKYIGKMDIDQRKDIGRIRYIQTSQGWSNLEDASNLDWGMKSGIYRDDIERAWEHGGNVMDIQTGEILTYDNFNDTYIYPPEFDNTTI